ncbi:MAG: hypothetical protein FWC76_07020 [Defluviitaleaceae bacterium]|nr:hypothetical protein [Defluviitaleaceae bacterium]
MKKILSILLAAMVLIGLAGCGSEESPFVGTWRGVSLEIIVDGEATYADAPETVQFFADGTGFDSTEGIGDFTWVTRDGVVNITYGNSTDFAYYEISGSILTMTFVINESVTIVEILERVD